MKQEQFDINKWKSGDYDVVTRKGKSVKIIYTNALGSWPIIGLIYEAFTNSEECMSYHIDGRHYGNNDCEYDLFLVKKKWMPKNGDTYYYIGHYMDVFKTTYGYHYEK